MKQVPSTYLKDRKNEEKERDKMLMICPELNGSLKKTVKNRTENGGKNGFVR